MSIVVHVHFPIDRDDRDRLSQAPPEALAELARIREEHGVVFRYQLTRPGELLDVHEYPSIEAYEAFKRDAQPVIDSFNSGVGVAPTVTIWDAHEPNEGSSDQESA